MQLLFFAVSAIKSLPSLRVIQLLFFAVNAIPTIATLARPFAMQLFPRHPKTINRDFTRASAGIIDNKLIYSCGNIDAAR